MDVNLVLFKKSGSQKSFPMSAPSTIIGRRSSCDLCIPLMSVSKKHCQLNHADGKLTIQDLDSHNGTILNGNRIKEAEIKPGDAVKIGPLAFVFQINGQPEEITAPDWALKKSSSSEVEDIAADTAQALPDNFNNLENDEVFDETNAPV